PSSGDLNTLAGITRRGFTGHEHLDAVGLIHMNGRVYEPVAGRFLSVDPIRIRGLPQDSNPYSYGWNNPIRIVDPSGWKEEDLETKREREDDPPAGPPTPVGPVVVTNTPIAPPLSPPVHVPIVAGDIGSSFGEVGFGGNSPQPPEPKQEDEPPPCGNGQTQEPQGQRKLMRLPQNAEESGYYNYGTPGGGEGQFGRPETIQLILDVGHSWARTGASDFGVGNISLEDGSYFPPHSPTGSHTTGFGFDVRPMRLDGAASPSTWTSSKYDRAATQALVDQFVSTGRVRNILFNDPKIRGVSPSQGHDNHLHVNVKPSCKK
ncbi:MAG TPA: RHS repeat-associated core domain-containing protein, partial [Steroidobacteraceae bacterium]|nr:RHS repeat-associated core domain-containing protein [Steroidobacteraceae bacterium]